MKTFLTILKFLSQVIIILILTSYIVYIYKNDLFYQLVFIIVGIICVVALIVGYCSKMSLPLFLCLYEGDILTYFEKLDKDNRNEKIYIISKNNERKLYTPVRNFFLSSLTFILILLTFTDKSKFNTEQFSKININEILNYKFNFISDVHFWFCISIVLFYYWIINIKRKNVSKVLFKYFDLETFKRNKENRSRLLDKHQK